MTALLKILKFLLYIFNGHKPVGPCRESAKLVENQQKSQQIFLGRKSAKLA
jgi:hypothetical protein